VTSGRRSRAQRGKVIPSENEGLWARSDILPDGNYAVTVSVGSDRIWTLDRDGAIRYALTLLRAAQEADHDAAVFRALTHAEVPPDAAAHGISKDLRPDRPPLDHDATAPLKVEPGVNEALQPFLKLSLDGKPFGQVGVDGAADHALGVLSAMLSVDLDAALHRWLIGTIGLDTPKAKAFVHSLIEHRIELDVVPSTST